MTYGDSTHFTNENNNHTSRGSDNTINDDNDNGKYLKTMINKAICSATIFYTLNI